MELWSELIKFIIYSLLLVVVSKYLLVKVLRRFAEAIDLKAKTVGSLAGIATSVPELLSVGFSASAGLIGASIYNIISSNIINLVQYVFAIVLNKNTKDLKNKRIRMDLVLVGITILIPLALLKSQFGTSIGIVPIFFILFVVLYFINSRMHKAYAQEENKEELQNIEEEKKQIKGKKKIVLIYLVYLILIGILLFVIGNQLSNVLESLCLRFSIPEFAIGIALGVITSLPELITFIESQKHHTGQNNRELGVVEATNNLLTSNLLNLFIIQSIGIILYTIFH